MCVGDVKANAPRPPLNPGLLDSGNRLHTRGAAPVPRADRASPRTRGPPPSPASAGQRAAASPGGRPRSGGAPRHPASRSCVGGFMFHQVTTAASQEHSRNGSRRRLLGMRTARSGKPWVVLAPRSCATRSRPLTCSSGRPARSRSGDLRSPTCRPSGRWDRRLGPGGCGR